MAMKRRGAGLEKGVWNVPRILMGRKSVSGLCTLKSENLNLKTKQT